MKRKPKKEKQLRRKTRHKPPTATSINFVVQVNMKIKLHHARKTKVNKVMQPPANQVVSQDNYVVHSNCKSAERNFLMRQIPFVHIS
jgi:hypothetical protein